MLDDSGHLNHTIITLPGDVRSMTIVGDYFKSMGINLYPKEPETYTLSVLLKSYFENHQDKKNAEKLFSKIQKKQC